MKTFLRYLTIWWLMSRNSFLAVFNQKVALFIFLTGKILRFMFFLGFIYFLVKGTNGILGYGSTQIIFFFLTFNLIDIVSQFLFREVYRFRPLVVSGDLDLVLVKPVSSLFRVLMGGADVIDLITIPPMIIAVYIVGTSLNPTLIQTIFYILLLINGLVISTAFHIAVLSMGIITLEIDHLIMIYRDFVALGRFPVDIYKEPIKGILTYLIPVGIMITFPAKTLMGLIAPEGILISFMVGALAVFVSYRFWNYALRFYTSASS